MGREHGRVSYHQEICVPRDDLFMPNDEAAANEEVAPTIELRPRRMAILHFPDGSMEIMRMIGPQMERNARSADTVTGPARLTFGREA